MSQAEFQSPAGFHIKRHTDLLTDSQDIDFLIGRLNSECGAYFSSGVEDPDRYSRWDMGFVAPPLSFTAYGKTVEIEALNAYGRALLAILRPIFVNPSESDWQVTDETPDKLELSIAVSDAVFPEEARSRQPSVFSPLRALQKALAVTDDSFLGLYGGFGYDLIFQFEPMELTLPRTRRDKAYRLFLPDQVYVHDRRLETCTRYSYHFSDSQQDTALAGPSPSVPVGDTQKPAEAPTLNGLVPVPGVVSGIMSDHRPEDYMALVRQARERIRVGDIFEVVLSRQFTAPYAGQPSDLYRAMRRVNPSPYEFLIQFGDEQLVGASPEMFVRVDGDRVESCPISGTIRRGANAMEDADRIRELYNSDKDEVELTMCTDVDRNDKSRICRPGTVKLLARRLIERYAGLFHTVDHVEGRLREGYDGFDAFLSHMWAVTLTGAPKPKAVSIIEENEKSPRVWYGGAVGVLGMNGNVNTGITIRTVHLHDGIADYRSGATLVWDSEPAAEEEETQIKATSFFRVMAAASGSAQSGHNAANMPSPARVGEGRKIVMIDNADSFVHTLADYFRQTGADVTTFRAGTPIPHLLSMQPDLVMHSPGPGRPAEFGVPEAVRALADAGIPQFGVCLGLQGIVEAFGGKLRLLDEPHHGKRWHVRHSAEGLFTGIPNPCEVAGYHSLVADENAIPGSIDILARNETGLIMAIQHRELPIAAVQFHPESILSFANDAGIAFVRNVVAQLRV